MSEIKEWTLMFYFASDNPLAPEIVSQLKALKNAGYHPDVNVVAFFDPQSFGPSAHIIDVNAFDKLGNSGPKIGDANDPYVRDLMRDKLWGNEKNRHGKPIIDLMQELVDKPGITYNLPKLPSSSNGNADSRKGGARFLTSNQANESDSDSGPEGSLPTFLDLCARKYQAKHYMLFILGHGLVVGDDVFLFDEHAVTHSITLRDLGQVLKQFKTQIQKIPGAKFELVSFHSCSMSSVEVAFELQGTAKYMLASQGPAFVGTWPYRQILMRVFNDVKEKNLKTAKDVEEMIKKIFYLVYYNSMDFILAGYSFDLCLCDLSKSIAAIKGPLKALSKVLIESLTLGNDVLTGCILLAHWKSQSYFNENYTDLFDFCFCLSEYCEKFIKAVRTSGPYKKLRDASNQVITAFPGQPVIRANFVGPESQHSHGFSIFFPWTRPIEDKLIMKEYKDYRFKATDWLKFLNKYWGPEKYSESVKYRESVKESTMRDSRKAEDMRTSENAKLSTERDNLMEDIVNLMFNAEGPLNMSGALNADKPNPQSSMGDGCRCGSIKNYRRDTRARDDRSNKANQAIQVRRAAQRKA